MVEIPTHKPYIFWMVMISCINLHVRQVPRGVIPTPHYAIRRLLLLLLFDPRGQNENFVTLLRINKTCIITSSNITFQHLETEMKFK